jgi:phosphoesterase RecJ-like protein
MKEKILQKIEDFTSIIIARHKNPDLDAYGSQFGLYYALKDKYPSKSIYVVGDTNKLNKFQELDVLGDDVYNNSLLIILDTVSKQMLDSNIYQNYKELILIDHHRNTADIEYDYLYQDVSASSCSEIVTELLLDWNIPINYESAKALYTGIIGDTGRFMFGSTTSKTLLLASKLLDKGIDIQAIHDDIYLETKASKTLKNKFFNNIMYTKNNVAYSKNDLDYLLENKLDTNSVSRGLVNQMSGMVEVKVWINFTYDIESSKIICEMRSRNIPVLEIAKNYGGGGHMNACGCTLSDWEEADEVLEIVDRLVEEFNYEHR